MSAAIQAVSAALLEGRVLLAPRGPTVGPYRCATDPPGEVRFACILFDGEPLIPFEVTPVLVERIYGLDYEDGYGPDWSAFGAARQFVREVGADVADRLLTELRSNEA